MLKNKATGISIIHPLTAFIHWRWKYKEYNTQRLHGVHLAQFLNYILIEHRHKYNLDSLSKLLFAHGTDFLNSLLINNKYNNSVKNIERTLVAFYSFLAGKNCLSNYAPIDFEVKESLRPNIKKYIVSPFNPMYSKEYGLEANRDRKAIEHTLPDKYIFPFIKVAISLSPSIAFAIYLSIFGGLRAGEIVNIRHSDITPYGDRNCKDGLKVLLRTNNLRTDIKDSSGTSRVKRERHQFVFSVKGALPELFKQHINYLQKRLGPNGWKNDDPIFINRDRKALTGQSLRYSFDKVKETFLQMLSQSQNPDDIITAINLKSTRWSFHIGRGTFTNLLAKVAKNPYEIALPRGDKSILSALTYMADTEEMRKTIESLLDDIYKGSDSINNIKKGHNNEIIH